MAKERRGKSRERETLFYREAKQMGVACLTWSWQLPLRTTPAPDTEAVGGGKKGVIFLGSICRTRIQTVGLSCGLSRPNLASGLALSLSTQYCLVNPFTLSSTPTLGAQASRGGRYALKL